MLNRFINWIASKSSAHQALRRAYDRNATMLSSHACALREILDTTEKVKVPNGTTKKVNRIARSAFYKAVAL